MHGIEPRIIDLIRSWFDAMGWWGVILPIAIVSACIPLPSEIIMSLTGWLIVSELGLGWQGILLTSFYCALGNLIGSIVTNWVGVLGGRPLVEKYGRWILVTHKDLDRANHRFSRWGELTTFVAPLLPIVRTFISFPAGVARMNFLRCSIFTFLGSLIWSIPLTAAGYKWGPDWETFRNARVLDYPIAAIILLAVPWFVWHRLHELRADGTASSFGL